LRQLQGGRRSLGAAASELGPGQGAGQRCG